MKACRLEMLCSPRMGQQLQQHTVMWLDPVVQALRANGEVRGLQHRQQLLQVLGKDATMPLQPLHLGGDT
jgi:hypothetical protein